MSNHTSTDYKVKDHNNIDRTIEVHRVDNDVNGNPRYVVHFLPFGSNYLKTVKLFNDAIHGRKYTAKWFGGGIVFSSYNVGDCLRTVFELKAERIAKARTFTVKELEVLQAGLEYFHNDIDDKEVRKLVAGPLNIENSDYSKINNFMMGLFHKITAGISD